MFKGSFDSLGTRVGILLASMIDPTAATNQLMLKYTHEIKVEAITDTQRIYKYDEVRKQQDFSGWKPRTKKSWIEEQEFSPIPLDVYTQYDEMRKALVDEMFVAIEDSMAFDTVDRAIKRMGPLHYQLLRFIQKYGMVNHHKLKNEFGQEGLDAKSWLKSYGLLVAVRKKGAYYNYDITALGNEVLNEVGTQPSQFSKEIIN